MSFKMKSPYNIEDMSIPVYHQKEEPGVMGRATNAGTITINKDIKDPKLYADVLAHEKVHVEQTKCGDLFYDHNHIYYKNRKIKRGKGVDGNPNLPHEKEAYKKSNTKKYIKK